MKIAVIIVRILLGLIFAASAIVVLFKLVPVPELTGTAKLFNDGVVATGYFMPVLKTIELICGIALVVGIFLPLTTVVIFPITLNIFLYHAFVFPQGLPVAIFMLLGNLFLAYNYRAKYAPMLTMK